jgi:hypothetical protein
VAAALAASQPGGGVQDPVAQGLGLGFGEVAVEGKQLQSSASTRPRSWISSREVASAFACRQACLIGQGPQ